MTDDSDSDSIETVEHMLNSQLMPALQTTSSTDRQFTARLERGGVKNYDRRFISLNYTPSDSGTTRSLMKLDPQQLPTVINILTGMLDAFQDTDLRVPPCIYCGESLDSVEHAETHHEEQHADRTPRSEFDPAYYEPDPNGSIEELRTD